MLFCFSVGFFLFGQQATFCFLSNLILLLYRKAPMVNDSYYCFLNVWPWGVGVAITILLCNGWLLFFWSAFFGSKSHLLFPGQPNLHYQNYRAYGERFGTSVSQCVSLVCCISDQLFVVQWLIVCFSVFCFLFFQQATFCFLAQPISSLITNVTTGNDSDYHYLNVYQWWVRFTILLLLCNVWLFAFCWLLFCPKKHLLFPI